VSGSIESWDLSVLQARGAGVEARDGFRDGNSIFIANIRPIRRPEALPEWVLRTKRVIFLSDCFSMGYPNEAWGIGQLSGFFGVIDQELRSE
jgi:hypothetical protein